MSPSCGIDPVEQARRLVFGYHDARSLGNRACRDAAEPKDAAGRGVCDGICRVCGRCYNLDAVDYIVKPVEDARLSKALDKIETALGVRRAVHTPRQPLRLTVDRGGKKVFIPVADVCYFEARADFCNAVCAEGTYLINESISSLERRLASEGFIRVHRSYLVNLEDVHNVEIGSTGLMELRLDRVTSTVPVSRRRAAEVKTHLGLA